MGRVWSLPLQGYFSRSVATRLVLFKLQPSHSFPPQESPTLFTAEHNRDAVGPEVSHQWSPTKPCDLVSVSHLSEPHTSYLSQEEGYPLARTLSGLRTGGACADRCYRQVGAGMCREAEARARTVELGDPRGSFLATPRHASLPGWLCVPLLDTSKSPVSPAPL